MSETRKLAVSTKEAAQMLSVSQRTIQCYVTAKLLKSRRLGSRTLILVSDLEEFLRTDHPSPEAGAASA